MNTSGIALGTLSLGRSANINGASYTLNLSGSSLAVSVAEIDATTPEITRISGSPTTSTMGSVMVTAAFTDNVAVDSIYCMLGDSGTWRSCSNSVTVTENAIVSFKAVDLAGNESNVYSYIVSNIENVPPAPVFVLPEDLQFFAGDFAGNGKALLAVKNENQVSIFRNRGVVWGEFALGDGWEVAGSGDFDGNGSHDIAMINGEGVVGIWGVSDGYLSSWSVLSAVDPSSWVLAGVGGFNGDGTDDIAWCGTSDGLVCYWQINDKTLTSWQNLATIA